MHHTCGFSSFVEKQSLSSHFPKESSTTIVLYKTKLNTLYTGTHEIYLERLSFHSPRNSKPRDCSRDCSSNPSNPRDCSRDCSSNPSSPTIPRFSSLNQTDCGYAACPRQSTFIHELQLQSFVNGTTIRVYDIQENDLDINTLYSYSELKKKELKVIDPEEPDYASDCLVYAYEFIEFLKEHSIKYPVTELFILYNAPELENAFWNGYYLTFGNGLSNRSKALVSPAIVGHELFHSVIQNSINLTYYGESGALNESYSDIFGVMFEFWLEEKQRGIGYELGSELFFDGHSMRSFKNPNKCGQPASTKDPLFYRGREDNAGVHINSNIINHLFYLLQLEIGQKEVFDIFLKVYFKLKHNSTFSEFKELLLRYAINGTNYSSIIYSIL